MIKSISAKKNISQKSKKIIPARDREIQPVKIPLLTEWRIFIKDNGLTSEQARALKFVIMHVKKDIQNYNKNRNKKLPRKELVSKLESLGKALSSLQYIISRNSSLLPQLLPDDALAHIGRSTSISTIERVVGERKSSLYYDGEIQRLVSKKKSVTVENIESLLRPAREAAGLNHGAELFEAYINGVQTAVQKCIDLNKLDTGGAPSRVARHYLMYGLARSYREIFGTQIPISRGSKFVKMCSELLPLCKISAKGVAAKAEEVARLVRVEQDANYAPES